MAFRQFEDTRKFVHALGLKNEHDWRMYCKSPNFPSDIPKAPAAYYRKQWKGWGDWLGTRRVANQNRVYRPFEEARVFVHTLGLQSWTAWKTYCKSGNKPNDIPTNPITVYKESWKGIDDWLQTGRIPIRERKYRSFQEARDYARKLSLKSKDEWILHCKSGKVSPDIPYTPSHKYRGDWQGWGDWLGTGTIASYNMSYRSFEEAREFARALHLKDGHEWDKYAKSSRRPTDIPKTPRAVYEEKWVSMGDWLGTWSIASIYKKFSDFEGARGYVRTLSMKSQAEWNRYAKSPDRRPDIPANPARTYENEWQGWGDWLGNGRVANQDRTFRPFSEAKAFIHTLGLKSRVEWDRYCRSGKKPVDIPLEPWNAYRRPDRTTD